MEYKHLPQFTKAITDRTVTGIFAVHGNVDEGGDRSWPGSFASIAVNGRTRARFVWQHRTDEPPIAVIKSVREVPRVELPPSVLGYAPEATGGVEVTREYLETPRGSEVLAGIKAGAIDEMSYAYDVTRFDYEEANGAMVRNIREVKLYDISDVLWGMNPATVGAKALPPGVAPLNVYANAVEAAVAHIEAFQREVFDLEERRAKAGRMISEANLKVIDDALDAGERFVTALRELRDRATPSDSGKMLDSLYLEFLQTEAKFTGVRIHV